MNVHLIDCASSKGQTREKVVDGFLIAAEEKAGKRLRMFLHLLNGRINVLIGENREKRTKDFIFHYWIVPGDWINNGGIDIACLRIGYAARDDFRLIDKVREPLDSLWAYNSRIIVGPALRISPIQLDHCFFALLYKLLGNGFLHVGVSR